MSRNNQANLTFATWHHDIPRVLHEVAGNQAPEPAQMESAFEYLSTENLDIGQDNLQLMRETASPGSRLNFNIGKDGPVSIKADIKLFGSGLRAQVIRE